MPLITFLSRQSDGSMVHTWGPLRIRNLKYVKLLRRAATTYICWFWHMDSLAMVVMGVSIPTSQPYAVTTTTENGVRIMARVQNAVFITFVHSSISHPKWNRFGQFQNRTRVLTLSVL